MSAPQMIAFEGSAIAGLLQVGEFCYFHQID